jgi:hypothetical protein
VKWDTGGVSEAPLSAVRADFPDLVKTFYRKARKPNTTTAAAGPEKKKPRVESQLQSQGHCTCLHTDSTTFVSEDDARFWDTGCTYHGRMCNMCGNTSRPISKRKPSYTCVEALTHGCLAILCHSCHVQMIVCDVLEIVCTV